MKRPRLGVPQAAGIRRHRGTNQGVGHLRSGSLEVAMDERLHHRRQQKRRGQATDSSSQKMKDRQHALGQGHRQSAHRICKQTHDVCRLASE